MMVKTKARWRRLTNLEVVEKFKQDGCVNCGGKGYVGEDPNYKICSCVTLALRREGDALRSEGKFRFRKQRIGNRDVEWFEVRDIGAI